MKTRTKVSIAIPMILLGVLLTANIAADANPPAPGPETTTPIQHVVVIFDENTSFDHYFATYPVATNPPDEPQFTAAPDTPSVVGLGGPLLTENPNALAAGNPLYNPVRLDRTEPVTCDNSNHYLAEQKAYNGGLVNMFPENTGCNNGVGTYDDSIAMDYYDGNTVTALWNYAQNYALNDNAFGTTFGPSLVGALNVISGLGGPAVAYTTTSVPTNTMTLPIPGANTSTNVKGTLVNGQLIANVDPTYDDCSYSGQPDASTETAAFAPGALNIGNLLNAAGVTWGFFEGGFAPTVPYNPTTGAPAQCGESEAQVGGTVQGAYSTHYDAFQYFASTANPHHLPPSSPAMIGYTDQANHQYDISDFWIAADSGDLPAVSYLKAPSYQTGHPANSDPLDEQAWLVNTINRLESLPTWSSTAIIINWDDSDGWYDSVMPPIVSPSSDSTNDALNGAGACGQGTSPLGVEDRCGYGPRIPLLMISPYAKSDYVDNTLATQTAIVSFIEYNWNLAAETPGLLGPSSYDTMAGSITNMFDFSHLARFGDSRLFLNPSTGEVVDARPAPPGPGSALQPGPGGFTNNGVPNLSTTSTCTDVESNPDICATENDLGPGPIAAGDYVWFSASADVVTREATPTTLYFTGQWINLQLKGGNGIPLRIAMPNSEVVFSSSATTETTTYSGGQWVTTVPIGYAGNVFLGGAAYQVPAGVSLAGAQADWQGVFSGTTVSFTLTWQWAAAVYSTLGTGLGTGTGSSAGTTAFYDALGVNPNSASLTSNPAGTPENFVTDYLSSATVGTHHGGSSGQYTGAYNQQGNAYYQTYLLDE
jgi:phospholipase C